MIKSFVITTVSGFLIHFVLHWLPRLFPYHPPPGATRWSLEQLTRLYARIDSTLVYLMIGGYTVMPFVCYVLLLGWGLLVYPAPGTPGMIMTPSWIYWSAVAVMAGWPPLAVYRHFFLRRILGWRFAEFRLYRKWKSGRALPIIYGIFGVAGVLMLAVSFYGLSTTYTVFRTDRIVIAKPFRGTVSHPYYDIAEIRAVKRSNRGSKKRVSGWYEIEFHDGTVWHAGAAFRFTDPCATFPFIVFAAERGRRPITGPDLFAEKGCEAS